jgi:hypothetical protein
MGRVSLQKTEFKRVVKFAESLGLKVHFIDAQKRDYHGCYVHPEKFEPGLIEVCRTKRTTITFQIAILLHEIGHHLDFIKTEKLPDSYNLIDSEDCPDWARVSIFNAERRACKNAEKLFWTLRLRIPFWKIKMELSVDIFLYGVFKRTGDYPREKEIESFRKNWKRKFKERYTKATAPRIKPLN